MLKYVNTCLTVCVFMSEREHACVPLLLFMVDTTCDILHSLVTIDQGNARFPRLPGEMCHQQGTSIPSICEDRFNTYIRTDKQTVYILIKDRDK